MQCCSFIPPFNHAEHAGIQVNDEVHRVRDYCQNFAPRRTDASEQIVRRMVAEHVKQPYYWALIMNLGPETVDEFVHLLPDLDVRILSCRPRSCAGTVLDHWKHTVLFASVSEIVFAAWSPTLGKQSRSGFRTVVIIL